MAIRLNHSAQESVYVRRAQPEVRPPNVVQDTVRHRGRDRVARAGDWRERGDLLPVQSASARAAAGARGGAACEPAGARTETRLHVVQSGRRLRVGVQLSDVSRSRAGADAVHWYRGA